MRAGKVRALGASAMYAYQFHNMQIAAEQNGWTKFTVMQPHYNLLYREDEREMIPLCREQNVAIMPYSPLASGHLARPTWNSDSLRGTTDDAQHDKYDPAQAKDMPIIERVAEIAQRKGVPMANIALAWLWERGVESAIVGCSKPSRVDDAANACAVALSSEEMDYLCLIDAIAPMLECRRLSRTGECIEECFSGRSRKIVRFWNVSRFGHERSIAWGDTVRLRSSNC